MKHSIVGLALAAAALAAHAGRPCEERPLDTASVERAMTLAHATAQRLDASGAQVVVLARAGQDLSRWGLRYSHLGFAVRDGALWRVVHKLNHCGTAEGALYRQGLGEFFLDRLHRHDAAFVVLAPQVQDALAPLLRDNARLAQWHAAPYSMLAYPWAQRYQQSNQWAIETLAGALEAGARTRGQAQAWLQLRGYEPTVLRLSTPTRLGARLTQANIAFDDHPNDKRFAGRIETVTVDSVFAWLATSGLGGAPVVVSEGTR
jgi:hypothetical protein